MANYGLIDAYLDELAGAIRWRDDADDIIDETEDHLRCAVERRIGEGADSEAAQRDTLEAFGDPMVIARAFAMTSSGRLAVPSRSTRTPQLHQGALPADPASAIDEIIANYNRPWMKFFIAYDPAPDLRALQIPVLAIFAELDLQASAELNVPAAQAALQDNPDATVMSGVSPRSHCFWTRDAASANR